MSTSFNVSGIASGLDWKTMVDQMMALERNPLIRLQTRKKNLQDKNSAFQDINTKLLNLDKALGDLMLDANLKPKKATVNSPTIAGATSPTVSVSATASPDAPVGSYTFVVSQLATASTLGSTSKLGANITDLSKKLSDLNFSQSITSGNMYLSINGTETIAVAIDPLNDTLQSVFTKISTLSGGRLTASLAGNKITIAAQPSVTSLSVGTGRDTSNFASATFLN
ncbi:MAG TPA: flagellar cap protein FliD N-terminal domain-containing protein, partial [Chroococcales cyanobacterium]